MSQPIINSCRVEINKKDIKNINDINDYEYSFNYKKDTNVLLVTIVNKFNNQKNVYKTEGFFIKLEKQEVCFKVVQESVQESIQLERVKLFFCNEPRFMLFLKILIMEVNFTSQKEYIEQFLNKNYRSEYIFKPYMVEIFPTNTIYISDIIYLSFMAIQFKKIIYTDYDTFAFFPKKSSEPPLHANYEDVPSLSGLICKKQKASTDINNASHHYLQQNAYLIDSGRKVFLFERLKDDSYVASAFLRPTLPSNEIIWLFKEQQADFVANDFIAGILVTNFLYFFEYSEFTNEGESILILPTKEIKLVSNQYIVQHYAYPCANFRALKGSFDVRLTYGNSTFFVRNRELHKYLTEHSVEFQHGDFLFKFHQGKLYYTKKEYLKKSNLMIPIKQISLFLSEGQTPYIIFEDVYKSFFYIMPTKEDEVIMERVLNPGLKFGLYSKKRIAFSIENKTDIFLIALDTHNKMSLYQFDRNSQNASLIFPTVNVNFFAKKNNGHVYVRSIGFDTEYSRDNYYDIIMPHSKEVKFNNYDKRFGYKVKIELISITPNSNFTPICMPNFFKTQMNSKDHWIFSRKCLCKNMFFDFVTIVTISHKNGKKVLEIVLNDCPVYSLYYSYFYQLVSLFPARFYIFHVNAAHWEQAVNSKRVEKPLGNCQICMKYSIDEDPSFTVFCCERSERCEKFKDTQSNIFKFRCPFNL